jgi:hypothetical protein
MAFGQYSGGIGAVAGSIIGGIIGFYTPMGAYQGAMLGASIGGMAGGIAGNVFWPEKVDITHPLPPKPHENRVQVSTYGAPIPVVYESARVAGNIIYMSDVVEDIDRSRHRQDGVRYYEMEKTYTSTFAIAFSEGPVVGLARIWVNGKIFADYRDPDGPYYPTGDMGLASANLSTTIARAAAYYSVYLGTETQTADPAISALLTAAETPTYRGIFYIVFRDFPVGEFSGVPTIEVEIDTPMTDTCSEYFTGTDGDSPSDEVFTVVHTLGNPPTIYNNSLKFSNTTPSSLRYDYECNFEFLGEFDINISFNVAISDYGWIYIGLSESVIMFFQMYDGTDREYQADTSVMTSDLSGKLRLTRNASDEVYCYYWNAALSRWEWNGNVSGEYLATISGALYPIIGCEIPSETATISIDEFVTVSGCDNTQPRPS